MTTNLQETLQGMEYTTETEGQVAITMRDDPPSPSFSEYDDVDPMQHVRVYLVVLIRTFLLCVFAAIRKWGAKEAEDIASEDNGVFAIIFIITISVTELVGLVLWNTMEYLYLQTYDIKFTILIFIGSFSAFLAPFSLLMGFLLPSKFNWIGFLVAYVMFGIMATCFYLDDQQQHKRSSVYNDYVLSIVFCLTCSSFSLLPIVDYFNWFAHLLIYLSLGLETVYHIITCLMFIIEKARTRKLSILEAHLLEKSNKHPRNNYLPIFRMWM